MSEIITNPKVDEFINNEDKWREEFKALRAIVLPSGLTEELKWGVPCYALGGKNVLLIHGFKMYCAILFVKGSLLKDPQGVLIQQTENVQAGRQIRFANVEQIAEMAPTLKEYITEAIEIEKAGKQVEFNTEEHKIPEELQSKFDENPVLKDAFHGLTPGRQRQYLLYFSDTKQTKTREARIEKYTRHILNGKGLGDD